MAYYEGVICTVLFVNAALCLFGGISAFLHWARSAIILYSSFLMLNVFLLIRMLSHLPIQKTLSPTSRWIITLLLTVVGIIMATALRRRIRNRISPVSIKESYDHLPCGLCFVWENGQLCLKNLKMDELCYQITGQPLMNGEDFRRVVESAPVRTMADGSTWLFDCKEISIARRKVYQIMGIDISEETRLHEALENEYRELREMNRRLRQYGLDVQNATREKELLNTKVRVHDDLGHVLLQTRQFLNGTNGDIRTICDAWRQSVRFLMDQSSEKPEVNSMEQLIRAAQAIGVTVEIIGCFPPLGTETAQIAENAAHECLTNLVRHANGTHLEICCERNAERWILRYRNNGSVPNGTIAEGSGLSALRAQTERAGGIMQVDSLPRFQLTLILPAERMNTL